MPISADARIGYNGAALLSRAVRPGSPGHAIDCNDCSLHEVCLVDGLTAEQVEQLAGMVSTRRKVKKGEPLFKAGDAFDSIYPIRYGFFKLRLFSPDGREQIVGFPMPGDLLGLDAIHSRRFASDAVALENAEVCVIPFSHLEKLSAQFAPLQSQLHRVLSREIVRDQSMLLMLGTMRAEARVASFIVNLSTRAAQRGLSSSQFSLRMTRAEIGIYLGLTLETVSRTLSRLQDDGLIAIDQKDLQILDLLALRRLMGVSC